MWWRSRFKVVVASCGFWLKCHASAVGVSDSEGEAVSVALGAKKSANKISINPSSPNDLPVRIDIGEKHESQEANPKID